MRRLSTLSLVLASVAALAQDQGVLLPIREHGKWGFIDQSARVRIVPQFEDAIDINNTFDGELEPVEKNGMWGFINRDGQWAIEPTFFLATKFEDGVAAVETDNGWTFINRSGQYLRDPDIKRVMEAGEKYWAVVRQGEDSWIYLNHSATHFLEIHQHIPQDFSEGLLAVEESGRWGYVDEAGRTVIPPKFDETNGFSESFAAVRIGKNGAISAEREPWLCSLNSVGPSASARDWPLSKSPPSGMASLIRAGKS